MATLLPSITTGRRASSSSLLSSVLGDVTVTGSCRVEPAVWGSPLGTRTDMVVTGPWLASWLAPILTSSPRTLSVSMLGPNLCWTAWTWAVEYPSLWKKSSWPSKSCWSEEGPGSVGNMVSQEDPWEFFTERHEGKIHAGVWECVKFRQVDVAASLVEFEDGKTATWAFMASAALCVSTCERIRAVPVSRLQSSNEKCVYLLF